MRPAIAETANNFIVNLNRGLSVSAASKTRVSYRIEQVDFALVSRKHEIGRVGIIWITLRRIASSRDGTINYSEITFVLSSQRRPHVFLV